MRLGGQVFLDNPEPETWAEALKNEGFRAAVFPVGGDADREII
ncbi:hypothetical protein [Paenibacillus tarimensis]|nr:hypothetical protein [Paenibacillus tarimensis]